MSESCKNLDATRFLYIGDKINLDGAECVCTQDRKINNKFNAIDLSNLYFPSLCGEPGGKFVVVVDVVVVAVVVVVVSNFVLCVLPFCL